MAKGPGTLYKECLAQARQIASQKNETDSIILEINERIGGYTIYEKDVYLHFLNSNYGMKKTEKCLKNWADLDIISRVKYKGFNLISFYPGVVTSE